MPSSRGSKVASSDRAMRAETTFPAGPGPNGVPRRRFVDRGRRTVGIAVFAGLRVTLAVSVLPELKFAYRSDEAARRDRDRGVPGARPRGAPVRGSRHPGAVAYRPAARLLADGAGRDQPLLLGACRPWSTRTPSGFATWAPAARPPARRGGLRRRGAAAERSGSCGRADRSLSASRWTAAALVLVAVLAAVFGDDLPRGLDPDLSPENAEEPHDRRARARPRRAHRDPAPVRRGHGRASCARRARARRADALGRSRDRASRRSRGSTTSCSRRSTREWVYVGDIIRLRSYFALLVGISREVLAYQRRPRTRRSTRSAGGSRASSTTASHRSSPSSAARGRG